jgi:hypothetical protein
MLQYSPKIVTDSLVMCLDASQNKSYPAASLPVNGGLVLWLDAADDTTFSYSSGTEVSQWRDKSGFNHHANQSTVAKQPSRSTVYNSRKSVNFVYANSDCFLISAASTLALPNDATIFIIHKPGTQTDNYAVLIDNYHTVYGNGFVLQRLSNLSSFYFANSNGSTFIDTGSSPWPYTDNTINLICLRKSGTVGTPYSNGTTLTSRTLYDPTVQSVTGLGIGALAAGGRQYNGEIFEIIIFNRALSDVQVKQVHTYLGQKWGILNTDRSFIDLAGNDDNGLLGNGTTANMPAFDYYNKGGFKFDGTNDYVKVGTNTSLQLNNVTIGAFFKTINNSQATQFIGGYGDTGYNGYWIGMSGGPITFYIGNGVVSPSGYLQLSSGVTPNNDQIYYVVGTYDGTSQKIYVDGVLKNTGTTVTGNIAYSGLTDGFLIGQIQGFSSVRYMTGNIYAMHVYNRALTATEIVKNYEALKSKFANTIIQQGLVLNLDAGNPFSYAGAGTTWYDTTANANNATASGTSYYSTLNGGLLNFPGNSSYYYTSTVSTFNLGSASFSIEAWVYLASGTSSDNTYRGIIALVADSNNYVYIAKWRSGLYSGLYVQYVAAATTITGVYQNNEYNPVSRWTHVIATKSGSSLTLYVNGAIVYTVTNLTTTFTGNSSVYISPALATSGVSTLDGYIGESRLYNIALSAAQVLQNYNARKTRFGL